MNDQQLQEIAAFRFGVIAPVLQRKLAPGHRYALLRELAAQTYTIPYSVSTRISIRSLERYLQAYEQGGGFEALKPKTREKRGSLHDLDPQVLSMALSLRHELPSRSVETIIRMLEIDQNNPLLPGMLKPRTLARYFQEQGVSKKDLARQANVTKAFRHFEHDEPNDCWQADTQHTTVIPDPQDPNKRRKVYLIALIDDHSRRIMHAEFFFEERYPRLENCLMKAVLKHGVPRIFYCDNGSVYNAKQLSIVCARMGTKLLHAKPYSPESKGEIEKFFQFVDSSFTGEVNLLIAQNKLQTLEQLNIYLRSWLEAYDQRVHRTTKQTPKTRFEASIQSIRRLSREELQALFLWEEERTVRKTAVIEVEGNRYDVDDALRSSKVQVRYNPFDLTHIQIWKDGVRYADAKAAELRSQRHSKLPTDEAKPDLPTPVASYVEQLKQEQEAKKRAELGTTRFAQLKARQNGGDGGC
ncbi:DDE-type integrase/transposase/recombinase [Paenibacillus alkaliterrae]|uniref:DDE-type integrase/transposase/recombinase n=1 Tax=Paenibacillus alkaliterrae TaxID=320909 RepID=UPI001F3FA470|nr:DDE-type integrase/transposase/recombinase [Paenibacillus alkaliterrae]MCF2941738.1 DDE-type integrase/transposase/recombinase [Paenibacillus alkaliterrae]